MEIVYSPELKIKLDREQKINLELKGVLEKLSTWTAHKIERCESGLGDTLFFYNWTQFKWFPWLRFLFSGDHSLQYYNGKIASPLYRLEEAKQIAEFLGCDIYVYRK